MDRDCGCCRHPYRSDDMTDIIKNQLNDIAEGFVRVGYYLRKTDETKLYKQKGYKTIYEYAKDTFGIGETAEMNDVQVTMVSYSENEGSEYNKPTDGNEYVMVEFEIVNNSENEITVSSALSFDGYADDYALNYSLAAMIENETSNQLDGTIAPGKKMDGMVGFEVPKDWKTIEIHFKDDVWSNSKFKFEIEK